APATPATPAASATRRSLPAALWDARGWWGGLIACGLAALGQYTLIAQSDPATATRYYFLAMALLILVCLHPAWPCRRRSASAPAPPPTPTALDPAPTNGAAPQPPTAPAPVTNGAAPPAQPPAPNGGGTMAPARPRVEAWMPGQPRANGGATPPLVVATAP